LKEINFAEDVISKVGNKNKLLSNEALSSVMRYLMNM